LRGAGDIDFTRPKVTITDYDYDVDNTRDISCFLIDSTEGMICNITNLELIVSATISSLDEDAQLNFSGVKVSGGHLNLNGYAVDFSNVIDGSINKIYPAALTVAKDADTVDPVHHHQNIKLNVTELNIVAAANTVRMRGVSLYGATLCDYFNLSSSYLKFSPGTDIFMPTTPPTYDNLPQFVCENNVLNTDSNYGALATGDMFYRNDDGRMIRLPVGATGDVLNVVTGGVPAWSAMFASGYYTPTLSQLVNSNTPTTFQTLYIWVGAICTVSGTLTFAPTTPGTQTQINISLPVGSTFTSTHNLAGVCTSSKGSICTLAADTTNNEATLTVPSPATGTHTVAFNFQYRIL
jgi:hypothetical protein